jgi:hypothetical protein
MVCLYEKIAVSMQYSYCYSDPRIRIGVAESRRGRRLGIGWYPPEGSSDLVTLRGYVSPTTSSSNIWGSSSYLRIGRSGDGPRHTK